MKVSYPPGNKRVCPLHWDIDFSKGPDYYIQGLVYLNDVPENRGPLVVIPGFHREIDSYLKKHRSPHEAIEALRSSDEIIPVPGSQGDFILWHQV